MNIQRSRELQFSYSEATGVRADKHGGSQNVIGATKQNKGEGGFEPRKFHVVCSHAGMAPVDCKVTKYECAKIKATKAADNEEANPPNHLARRNDCIVSEL